MELKQTVINNSGMSQDFSISKQDNKFAFENRNVRIQSTNDGTLLSVTNLRDPLQTNTYVGCHKVIGHCVTPNYLIVFALNRVRHGSIFIEYSTIYRIDLDSVESTENACKVLYNQPNKGNGALNLDSNFYIDTLYFEEGEYIKKVYWTDGKNNPRVINIITPGERVETGKVFQQYEKNVFEFYPEICNESYYEIPKITVTKNRSVASELPAGMIQYFISYYNANGAESLIVNSSDLYTIDYSDRGAKADETGMCAFNVSISGDSVNKNFDYIRVYSAIRTSYNGQLILKIVGDIKIDPNFNGDYTIIDNGILQEQLQDGFIYFIGGTPFIAKTLTEKDNTAFFGNIKTESVIIPENIRTLINNIFFKDSQFSKSEVIKFTLTKSIPLGKNIYNSKYPYTLQLNKGSKSYKTFKSGETYRFGIQFQTRKGQWTDVAWIGDVECTEKPKFDSASNCFLVNDVEFNLPSNSDFIDALNAENYVNYRILYADPEYSNGRKIKAQGVLCPTLFTPGQRAMNAPYSLPSWVMRPRNSKIAHHHFEPLFSAEVDGAEIASYTRHQKDGIEVNAEYTVPYIKIPKDSGERENKKCYVVTYLTISKGNKLIVRSVKVWVNPEDVKNNFYDSNGKEPTDYEIICDYCVPYGGTYNEYGKALMADPKSGSKNNPYGYIGKIGVYNTYHQEDTNDTAPTTGGVIGWIPAFKELGLPVQWIPSPNLLGDASYDLYWGRSKASLFYGASFPYDRYEDFYLCSHAEEYIATSSGGPAGFLSLKFLPVYGVSYGGASTDDTHRAIPQPKEGADPQIHSGAKYNTEDGLKDYEDLLFSKEKTFFKLKVAASFKHSLGSVCTLPEIFRPRCTVNGTGNQGVDWGSDASNYKHDADQIYDGIEGSWVKRESYIQIIPFNESFRQKEIEKSMNDYYVDESILTLHSPDIDNVSKDNRSIKLNVVGAIPLKYSQINLDSQINAYASILGGLNLNTIAAHNKEPYSPFYTDYFYNDIGWDYYSEGGTTEPEESLLISIPSIYKTYLFPANNFLGITSDEELSHLNRAFTEYPGIIKKQQIYNQYFSENTVYFKNPCEFDTVYCGKVTEDGESVTFNTSLNFGIYRPSYDNLVTSESTSHVYNNGSKIKNKLSFGTTRVKFSTTPHLILNLQDLDNKSHKYILPHFATESFFRDVVDGKKYVWNEDSEKTVEEGVTILAPRDLSDARKEWAQNSFNLNEYHIESIWDVPERSEVSPTTEDYFTFYNMYDGSHPDPGVKDRLNNAYSSDIINFILNNYTPQVYDNVTHYISEQNSPKVLVGIYRWLQAGQGSQHPYELSTELGYIRDFILNSDESAIEALEYEEIPSPFSDASNISLNTDAEKTDYNVVYKYHRVGSDPNIYPFYFKWYLNKGVDKMDDFWNYVERAEPYFPVQYESKTLATTESSYNSEYLFVGEVYYDIPNDLLYGGTSQVALKKLTWIPSSDIAPIVTRSVLNNMEGDTYYQRWDCLKTYPTTEEDANQIVDVTSFMVETHKNLDGRSDVWRGVPNLMVRPTNFNLFNTVYNQSNNIFEYVVGKSQNISTEVPNQIVWSMSKNRFGDVDSWTNTNTSSSTTVKYPVTKLLNYNNSVMALTENSVEVVNFNAKQLIPSTDNSFVELQNSNKVDGTVKLQAPYGTYNMNTLITEKGLYFIDDNERSIIRIGGEAGITKIGITSLGDFLKENIIKGTYVWSYRKPFRFEYDSVHKDIYLINDTHCIVYNETLDAFTSFIDYTGEYWLYNYNGKLFAYRHDDEENSLVVHNMYAGDGYNRDFQPLSTEGERNLLEYSVWYRINPNSYSDKVFTNGTLAADCGVAGNDYPLPNSTKTTQFFNPFYKEPENYINLNIPFDSIRVWNEYQDTENVPLVNVLDTRSTLKQKFRFWRFEIPRDKHSNFKRDRIRNPWIHLQLKGHSDKKMEFHNLTIQYME